jgi:redox-sensitive bicupin YhaK (pirin superfamily)
MTAASGVVHEEFHGPNYASTGGPFEMIQLWVNLPARMKMGEPGYQGITLDRIPEVLLPGGAGKVRVIAGDCLGVKGPARTHTPIRLWDMRLNAGKSSSFKIDPDQTTLLFVLSGGIETGAGTRVSPAELAVLEEQGDGFEIRAIEDSKVLFLGGEPLNEPIVGYGPFVMNTEEEIRQAFIDYRSGRMGRLDP